MALDDTNTGTPPAGTDTPAQAAAPAAQPDIKAMLADYAAQSKAAMDQALAQQAAAFRAELAALRGNPAPTAKPPVAPTAAAPAQAGTPAPGMTTLEVAPAPKPWEEDPEYQAMRTAQRETAAKQAEIEKRLAHETQLREKAEERASEAARHQAVYKALTELDNPVRADGDGGQQAAELLILKGLVKRGQDGAFYFVTADATGTKQSKPLTEGVREWLQTKEGARYRPPLPSGAGTSPGFVGGPPPGTNAAIPLSDNERMGLARQRDRQLDQMGRGPLN